MAVNLSKPYKTKGQTDHERASENDDVPMFKLGIDLELWLKLFIDIVNYILFITLTTSSHHLTTVATTITL